ncbi:MAG: zinc ribbon domain-containing protein [Chloroflexi bacterium]|nr:zinc ribbon domain-containing protein [Chloroflexota bacterium]
MNDLADGRRTLHRGALRVMLASVVVSALMGCYALLSEDWGKLEERLLLSTLSVFGTSMITLACGVAWERGRLSVVPPLGIALGLLGLVLLLGVIWTEPRTDSDVLWRGLATEITLALAATHASLVSIFGLKRRYEAVPIVTYVLNALLSATTLVGIWSDEVWNDDAFGRAYGALTVLVIAATIAIPVLRRLDGPALDPGRGETGARFCPNCGTGLEPPGEAACEVCGATFEVRVTTPPATWH